MPRFWIFSDLHLDAWRSQTWALPEPRPECDAVIIAGDIREDMVKGVRWIAAQSFGVPVVYVRGNHEGYRTTMDGTLRKARVESRGHAGIHVLDRDAVVIGGVEILGCTLWTDYELYGEASMTAAMIAARAGMNDHIVVRSESQGYRKWLPKDAFADHCQSRQWLEARLTADRPQVVVTHHAPSLKSVAESYLTDILSASYASHLDHLVDRAALWVHGHVHTACDYVRGSGRVICNPRGYPHESTGFEPGMVVEVRVETRDGGGDAA